MEFAEMIKISRVDNVRLRRPVHPPCQVTVAITGHHLILSAIGHQKDQEDEHREIWLLHRGICGIIKEQEGSRAGTLCIKYKDLRVFYLDVTGQDKFLALATSLEQLSSINDLLSSYPFFYNPGFKALEDGWSMFRPEEEFSKILLNFNSESAWRITYVNQERNYQVCPSYSRVAVVPSSITDNQIITSAKYRMGGRFPVLAYCHPGTGMGIPLIRASQAITPANRCHDDEKLLTAIVSLTGKKGYILNLNSSVSKGASEPDNAYLRWKNVHIRLSSKQDISESLYNLSAVCNDTNNDRWLSRLSSTGWLTQVKDALNAGCLAAQCLGHASTPVLLQESEGMDYALIVSSLAQIILNPDTRTCHGFEALVEREWLQAGHPFWSRNSRTPCSMVQNNAISVESVPTFLLFLDCVFQIYNQFPCSFEFTEKMLILLADHSQASPFGTFLSDSEQQRQKLGVRDHTVSLWSYLNQVQVLSTHLNCLYQPNPSIIWPSVAPMSIVLWNGYFLRWVQDQTAKIFERKRMSEIIARNKEAKRRTIKLRRELKDLQVKAIELGLLSESHCHSEASFSDGSASDRVFSE